MFMLAPSQHDDAVEDSRLYELPNGWVRATLGATLEIIRGVSYKKADARNEHEDGFLPILRATNISQSLNFRDLVYIPETYIKPPQFLQSGDIVIAASSGSRSVVGKAAQLKHEWTGSFGAFCFTLRPSTVLNKDYIAWFLHTHEYRTRVSKLSAGVNINNLKREHIENTPMLLAPLPEQRRIVAEIEKQFTRLDASVDGLKRAQANLKRYRASVLKAACEGTLVPTEAELARSEGRDYEPADRLLERILTERRAQWESQEKRRGKYKEPATPDTSNLENLPKGWTWATIGQISSRIQYGTSAKANADASGTPVIRMGNIREGDLDLSDLKYLPREHPETQKTLLAPGDLLFNRTNSSELVGKSAVYKGIHPAASFASYLIRVIFLARLSPDYACAYINSQHGRTYIGRVKSQQVGQANVNGTKLAAMPIPLPPLAEQHRIVAEVERHLSVIQKAEAAVDVSLKWAERLRQSILKQAFSGKLVPQDPDDEPASVLLERIRAERAEAAAKAQRKPRRRRSKSQPARQLKLSEQTP